MSLRPLIESLRSELIALRRDFHQHPELGFQEHRTAQIVVEYLERLGLQVKTLAGTGVTALLRGGEPGPRTLMLRADMDALPIHEATGLPFASSRPGIMHACGHDGHTAMLLVAAKVLCHYRDIVAGNVKFVFQPNEEDAGAEDMVAAGVLAEPDVDAALAIHLWSPLPLGTIGVAAGPIMASSDYFRLAIKGRGGHGGAPHEAVDPVLCAADVIQGVQAVQTRELSVLKPTLITIGQVHGGTSPIIVPEEIVLEGSLRCLHEDSAAAEAAFRRVIDAVCQAHRTGYDLTITRGNSLLANENHLTALIQHTAAKVVGSSNCLAHGVQMMIGEDFAEYARRVPGALYFVGAGNPAKGADYPHHHPRFNIDEDALLIGVEMHVRSALRYLHAASGPA